MPKCMHNIEVDKISFVGKAANKKSFVLFKSHRADAGADAGAGANASTISNSGAENTNVMDVSKSSEGAKEITMPNEKQESQGQAQQTQQAQPANETVVTIAKAELAAMNDLTKQQSEAINVLKQQLDALNSAIKEEKATAEAQGIAKGFNTLPIEPATLVSIVKTLKASLTKEDFSAFTDMLTKVQNLTQTSGLTGNSGHTSIRRSAPDSIKAADEAVKKMQELDPKLSKAEALVKYYRDNPDVYTKAYEDRPAADTKTDSSGLD